MAAGGKVFSSQLLPQHPLMAREEEEKAELDAMRRFLAIELIESLLRCSRFAHADKDKEPMNTQYDNDKFIECPCENATHVYFAGNVHLIAEEKQDVFWCIIGGGYFQFYAPGKSNFGFYISWYPGYAPASTQGPVFLKERELEVTFIAGGGYKSLCAICGGREVLAISLVKNCVHTGDTIHFEFDDTWTIAQIKAEAEKMVRKIAQGEA